MASAWFVLVAHIQTNNQLKTIPLQHSNSLCIDFIRSVSLGRSLSLSLFRLQAGRAKKKKKRERHCLSAREHVHFKSKLSFHSTCSNERFALKMFVNRMDVHNQTARHYKKHYKKRYRKKEWKKKKKKKKWRIQKAAHFVPEWLRWMEWSWSVRYACASNEYIMRLLRYKSFCLKLWMSESDSEQESGKSFTYSKIIRN